MIYATDSKEISKFVNTDEVEVPTEPLKIQYVINPNGKVLSSADVEMKLKNVNPAALITVDTRSNPATIRLSNIDFLRHTKFPFQIYVLITKNGQLYREGTIDFDGKQCHADSPYIYL